METIWDFLNANIVPLLSFLGLLIAVIIFVFVRLRPSKIGPVEFKLDKKYAHEIADRYLRSVEKIRELQRDVTQIENIDIIRDQMGHADIFLSELEKDIRQIHSEIVSSQTGDIAYSEIVNEIDSYAHRVQIAIEDIRNELRRSFRENHFHEKNPVEFNAYVNNQIADLVKVIDDINAVSRKSVVLDIVELRSKTGDQMLAFRKLFGKIYQKAWDITTEKREIMDEKLDQIKTIVARYLAHEPLDD